MKRKTAIIIGSKPEVKKPKDINIVLRHGTRVTVEEKSKGFTLVNLQMHFPEQYLVFESGLTSITIGLDYPRCDSLRLRTIKIDDKKITLNSWFKIDVAFVEKVGEKIWNVMSYDGDRFYYFYTDSCAKNGEPKCFFGKLEKNQLPRYDERYVRFVVLKHIPKHYKDYIEESDKFFTKLNPFYYSHSFSAVLTAGHKLHVDNLILKEVIDIIKLGDTENGILLRFSGFNMNDEYCYIIAEFKQN